MPSPALPPLSPAPTPYEVYIHAVWPVEDGGLLPPGVAEKLVGYVTRCAQTLKTTIYAVGAEPGGRALHLIFDLPPHLNLNELMRDLQKPSERWVSGALGNAGFRWATARLQSVSPPLRAAWIEAITSGQAPATATDDTNDATDGKDDADALPAWLHNALKATPDAP